MVDHGIAKQDQVPLLVDPVAKLVRSGTLEDHPARIKTMRDTPLIRHLRMMMQRIIEPLRAYLNDGLWRCWMTWKQRILGIQRKVWPWGLGVGGESFQKSMGMRLGDWRLFKLGSFGLEERWLAGSRYGWVELESELYIIFWHEQGSSSIESFSWFTALHNYSRPKKVVDTEAEEDDMDMDDEAPLGPEGDLVSEMVSKAVVPLLIKAFEAGGYDPYSTPQTRRAVDLADVVSELTGKGSRKYTVSPSTASSLPQAESP
jgi:hypothetical protein